MATTSSPAKSLRDLIRAHPWWFTAGGILVVVALVWLLWPATQPPPPRARQYLSYTACLLTGERGTTDASAAPVWAGMQDASLTTHIKIQYLAISGPQTVDNAVVFVNTLAQRNCDVVIAAGAVPATAVTKAAATFPKTAFYTVGATTNAPHVTRIDTTDPAAVRAAISQALNSTAPHAG
jgi:hypothetical protein